MKTKGNPKKKLLPEGDRFDRKSAKVNAHHRDKSTKRRLSIYDEFDEEDDWDSLNFDSDDFIDDTFEE